MTKHDDLLNRYDALLNFEQDGEAQEVVVPISYEEIKTKHDWRFVKVLHNDTKLWQCSVCGSETWTICSRTGNHVCKTPERGDLENSGTPEDCNAALVTNLMTEKTFGHRL
jgi:hypothetical protein